jgi:hypothetical protein
MDPKIGEKAPMSSAASIIEPTRSMAAHLVRRAEQESGSRMEAYQSVASAVGATPDWIRKFIGGSVKAKEPKATVWVNIIRHYDRICSRIDQAADNERELSRKIRGQLNAAAGSALAVVESAAGAEAAGATDEGNVPALAEREAVSTVAAGARVSLNDVGGVGSDVDR